MLMVFHLSPSFETLVLIISEGKWSNLTTLKNEITVIQRDEMECSKKCAEIESLLWKTRNKNGYIWHNY